MTATEPRPEDRHGTGQQLLSFYFGGEEYATEILCIREVVEYQRLTPVPTTPAWVRGVMNLRGTVVPVLDLATKFQYGETPVEKLTCIVIFEIDLDGEITPIGVMIDAVGRVLELRSDEIQEPPSFGSPVRTDLLLGIAMVGKTPIPILDIQKVLTEDELSLAVAGAEIAAAREREPETADPPKPVKTTEMAGKDAQSEKADGASPDRSKDGAKAPAQKKPAETKSKTSKEKPSRSKKASKKTSKKKRNAPGDAEGKKNGKDATGNGD